MNREIKFRAWDKTDKVWAKNNIVGGILYEIQANKEADVLDSYNLCQYTGLKDKNGIEIYEGDLLKYPSRNIAKVIFNEERATFNSVFIHNNKTNRYSGIVPKMTEVIGNIFENPELLK